MGYEYALRDGAGTVIEQGTAEVDANTRPAPIDLRPGAAGIRRGIWNVVDDRLELDYSEAGGQRPQSLGGATTYRTTR